MSDLYLPQLPVAMDIDMAVTQRPWGTYEVINDHYSFKSKRIIVKPFCRLSLQSHQHRSEHWICVSGSGFAQINQELVHLTPSKHVYIKSDDKHRLINNCDQPLVIVEIQTGTYFGEDDITRYEDDYGRIDHSGNLPLQRPREWP